jgi:hypothetical protein
VAHIDNHVIQDRRIILKDALCLKSRFELDSQRSAPEEHHVYSLNPQYLCAPAERHVHCRVQLHAAPGGAES